MTQSTAPAFSDPAEAARHALYREAQAVEYGTWKAAESIEVDGALAFRQGDPVPKSTVERLGWDKEGRVVPADVELTPENIAAVQDAQLAARLAAIQAESDAIRAELDNRKKPAEPAPTRRRASPPSTEE